jgi:mRNA-degrading endonuclease RelE of RelBE toxin-antitoxin system
MAKASVCQEIANKRVALTPSTWEDLSGIKKPGRSLGETVADLIAEHQLRQLEHDLDAIRKDGHYIPWEDARKELGLE